MLNGVGGRTIEEARLRMTYREFLIWRSYVDKYGSLNAGKRLDWTISKTASIFGGAQFKFAGGRTPVPNDFTAFPVVQEDEELPVEDTVAGVASLLSSLTVKGK